MAQNAASRRAKRRPPPAAIGSAKSEQVPKRSTVRDRQFLFRMAVELLVVFIGVTAAFLLDDYRSAREEDQKRQAVYRALDRELKQVAETHGPRFQNQLTRELAAWDRAVARGERPVPPAFRIERAEGPPAGVWDAAVASGSIELIDADLFFELARYYNRAQSSSDQYRRYVAFADTAVWPFLDEGPGAFWQPDGKLRPEIEAHVERLRVFRTRQRALVEDAQQLRAQISRAKRD